MKEPTLQELVRGLQNSSADAWLYLQELAITVWKTHYRKSAGKDDLISEATLKTVECLLSGEVPEDIKNLRSYLYTKMRNTMSNKEYHELKHKHNSLDEVEKIPSRDLLTVSRPSIERAIDTVFEQLPEYAEYKDEVRNRLHLLMQGQRVDGEVPEGLDRRTLERLFTATLWGVNEEFRSDGS